MPALERAAAVQLTDEERESVRDDLARLEDLAGQDLAGQDLAG